MAKKTASKQIEGTMKTCPICKKSGKLTVTKTRNHSRPGLSGGFIHRPSITRLVRYRRCGYCLESFKTVQVNDRPEERTFA